MSSVFFLAFLEYVQCALGHCSHVLSSHAFCQCSCKVLRKNILLLLIQNKNFTPVSPKSVRTYCHRAIKHLEHGKKVVERVLEKGFAE